jgi:hypothetical protein
MIGSRQLVGARHALEVVVHWKRQGVDVLGILDRTKGRSGQLIDSKDLVRTARTLVAVYRYEHKTLEGSGEPEAMARAKDLAPYVRYVAELADELEGVRKVPAELAVPPDVRATTVGMSEEMVLVLLRRDEVNLRTNGLKRALELPAWGPALIAAVAGALAEPALDGTLVKTAQERLATEVLRALEAKVRADPAALAACIKLLGE